MNWQVRYALDYLYSDFQKQGSVEHISGDAIRISIHGRPDVIAAISESTCLSIEEARRYQEAFPSLDFICGYRKKIIWKGETIHHLSNANIGWGNIATLRDAIKKDYVNSATNKDYFFSYRLLNQMRFIVNIDREFDRVVNISLKRGSSLRIGMLLDYEVTADVVRDFWQNFGSIDIMWSINPHGKPTESAKQAATELGCKVMKWPELKELIR